MVSRTDHGTAAQGIGGHVRPWCEGWTMCPWTRPARVFGNFVRPRRQPRTKKNPRPSTTGAPKSMSVHQNSVSIQPFFPVSMDISQDHCAGKETKKTEGALDSTNLGITRVVCPPCPKPGSQGECTWMFYTLCLCWDRSINTKRAHAAGKARRRRGSELRIWYESTWLRFCSIGRWTQQCTVLGLLGFIMLRTKLYILDNTVTLSVHEPGRTPQMWLR